MALQSVMEMLLQIGGVVVPCVSAFAGLFAWGVRRMDRRFEEAALDRRRIEMQLNERCDRLDATSKGDFNRLEVEFKGQSSRLEEEFKGQFSRLEEEFKTRSDRIEERCDRIEERIDRVAGQLSDQIMSLSLEIGKAQGAASAAAGAVPG